MEEGDGHDHAPFRRGGISDCVDAFFGWEVEYIDLVDLAL